MSLAPLEQARIGEISHHRGESSGAPPAYQELSNNSIIQPPKDKKEDTASINSSIPPDSPIRLDNDVEGPSAIPVVQPAPLPPSARSQNLDSVPGPHESLDVNHPFAFPLSDAPPSYFDTETASRPVAIPQLLPYPDVGFLLAYPPSLLSYGIPESTWLSFIATLSGFLNATVSEQAVAHASKVARSTANIPRKLGMGIYSDAKDGLKHIGHSAKKGNPFGVIGPLIGLPFSVVGRTVGSIFSLQDVYMQKPETPRQRADVYVGTANKRWFHPRGLHGRILSTPELANVAEAPVDAFSSQGQHASNAQQQMNALTSWIAPVNLHSDDASDLSSVDNPLSPQQSSSTKGKHKIATDSLMIGFNTLWLVIIQHDVTTKIPHKNDVAK